jgi:HK97 gp10 family phage protein
VVARLTPYPQGLQQALAAPPMVRACRLKMQLAEFYALAIAPVDTGWYRDNTPPPQVPEGAGGGFTVESGVRGTPPRAYGRLLNDTPHARFLEFGTRYMDAQRILGRAADALKL